MRASRLIGLTIVVALATAFAGSWRSAVAQAPAADVGSPSGTGPVIGRQGGAQEGMSRRPPQPPAPTVLNLGSYGHAVQNMDTALAFYREGMGLELVAPPGASRVDEQRNRVMNTIGAKSRVARFAIPNEPFFIELVEYTGIDRKPMSSHHNDPGSSFLNVGYIDTANEFQALRKFKPKLVGEGELPAGNNPSGRNMAWIRDPDDIMIEVMQGGWDGPLKAFPSVRNAYRAHFGVTLENYQQGLLFYRDLLGFDVTAGFPPILEAGHYRQAGTMMSKGLGIPAEANWTAISGHCANARCEMFEFKDAPRTAFLPRAQDPGAAYLSVWVSDLDALLVRMKAANIQVVTQGGTPVTVTSPMAGDVVRRSGGEEAPVRVQTSRQILVRDPGGFLVLLMQRVD